MSKLSKILAYVALSAGLAIALPGAAQARSGHHHGGWYGFGPGFALGFGLGYGAPYYYPPPYYYAPRRCGWVRVRVWRYGRWYWRRVWQCW